MNDTILRHIIAVVATLICGLAYFAGYFSGPFGWWWTAFAMLIVYGLVYRIVDAGGGGGHH
ncbi:MAG: hypothetical protein A3I29_04955 [Candidatus Magasanikbacteria bacterium RIFCSPLOWO2_02_FULL_44_11]|uniref:Uncharacterized protein n=2 Tax=Candidatus Magasanikiibacteriota TaxID=1752731 RepID=A0A1F6NAS0_9BACT|nr:MAG: hypothetical protein A3D53_02310 [Candidatus Magasanikbacteria bacterium RIFCSPHIGHO2_02_FULL_45_10]OGH80803.1 MAG: hypothetical protein A3I29_04955 [Candidatus Magasanikbacteria bacterium RIFCSPLOWO2_02_FULL_44_11]